MLIPLLLLLVGFVVLIVGGELLVRGAVRVAERAGMSELLIGLTIVGFGTSAPELVASVEAAHWLRPLFCGWSPALRGSRSPLAVLS